MARTVLVVEPDFDALGALASKLRARGLEVTIADDSASAVERAHASPPDAFVLSAALLDRDALLTRIAADAALSLVPVFSLVGTDLGRELALGELSQGDVEEIARRVHALPTRAGAAVEAGGDVRGNLQQVSILDLLQLLSMNRRSGTLSITTQAGAGEVRLADGEIVDAVYRRLEGEKALFRLFGENEGLFSFTSGGPQPLRRIVLATRMLLLEGMRHVDEVRQRASVIAAADEAFLAIVPPDSATDEAERRVLEVLSTPRALSELLDDVPLSDLGVLETLTRLLEAGQVRRIAAGVERVELAQPERLTVLAALAKRAARAGFRSPARVAIAASPHRLIALMHSVARISDAIVPTETVPAAPIPHAIATLRLGDGAQLEVIGLPLVEAYAPLWALVLPSCAAVARLELKVTEALDAACANAGVPAVDVASLLPDGAEGDPEQVAALLRLLLERAAEG
jgi:CheY-like chemotaxis protein